MSSRAAFIWCWVWIGACVLAAALDKSVATCMGLLNISAIFLALGYVLRALSK
jgi:hypothetical protein